MSLRQQGSQTAINKTKKIPMMTGRLIWPAVFIRMCEQDAQVLMRTWAAWGNLVRGAKYAIMTPSRAAGLTMYQSSIKPR